MMPSTDAWIVEDAIGCAVCGLEACEDHLPDTGATTHLGFAAEELEDAVDVASQGRAIEAHGVPYLLDGIIPAYGMLGFLVAYAKVGKTTFGHALAAHVANGDAFLERTTTATRVLVLAPEDPPEYTAWLARHLHVERDRLIFRRKSLLLTARDLDRINETVTRGAFGLVLIASWQAVIRGLIRDENDNAGAVEIVESVKAAARQTGIPWIIDAHSGKGEDQADEADPSKAMRGASAAAGAADYTLSLRYANGAFGTQRRLSGKGRFVTFAPLTLDFEPATSTFTVLGSPKDLSRETDWRLICDLGALDQHPRSANEIAQRIGIVKDGARAAGGHRKRIHDALHGRPHVGKVDALVCGHKTTLYRQLEGR